MKLLDRYVARELVVPFIWGVAAFSLIMLGTEDLGDLVRLAASGAPIGDVLRWFLYSMPHVVVLTFPMAMLLSTLLAFGKLSGDGEVVASFAGGISLYRMLVPALVVAVAVCIVTFGFNEGLVPWCRHRASVLYVQLGGKQASTKGIFIPEYDRLHPNQLDQLVTASHYDPATRKMQGVNLFVWNKDTGQAETWIVAEEARSESTRRDPGIWTFYHCSMYVRDKNGTIYQQVDQKDLYVGKTPDQIDQSLNSVKPEEMTYWRLAHYLREEHRRGAPETTDLLDAELNLYQKLAMPVTSLIFALIGTPMGLRPNRGSTSLGLGLSVIVIFIFYVIGKYLAILADGGAVSPVAAAWLPDVVGLAMGAVLVSQAPK